MEEGSIRAITIGAGLFMVILVLSAVFMYVDSAKQFANTTVKNVNQWKDINYENIMEYEEDTEIEVKGIDVINFIRKYVMRDDIQIKIENRGFGDFENISTWKNNIGNASEEKLQRLSTDSRVKMIKKKEGEVYKITVKEIAGRIFRDLEKIPGVLYGDINKDGRVDRKDLELLKNYLDILSGDKSIDDFKNNMYIKDMYENSQSNYREAADIFFDGVVDNKDLERLGSMVVRYTVTYALNNLTYSNSETDVYTGETYETSISSTNPNRYMLPNSISIKMSGNDLREGTDYTYNNLNGKIIINNITGHVVITATGNENTTFSYAKVITEQEGISGFKVELNKEQDVRIYKFIPSTAGKYVFYSNDSAASTKNTDPYAFIYSGASKSIEELDELLNGYTNKNDLKNHIASNDDGGDGYNFKMKQELDAGKTYYLVIVAYDQNDIETYNPVYIKRTCSFTINLEGLNMSSAMSNVLAGYNYSNTIKLSKKTSTYKLPNSIQVTMNGKTLTSGYTYDNKTGSISIPNITGDIVITAKAEQKTKYNITYNLDKLNYSNTTTSVYEQDQYTTRLSVNEYYKLPSTILVKMGGKELAQGTDYTYSNGKVTINKVTGNIMITAEAIKK